MVLKFWLVDGAGIKEEKKLESSRVPVRSEMPCHSVRIMLDRMGG
jgi:hypothetical protein